jgi:beta-N-acetylhexosaminidase
MQAKLVSALERLGELFLIGIRGLECSPQSAAFIREARIGGVILFSHNYESPEQVRALTDEIQALRKDSMWIAVDQEGGRVQRFKKGLTRYPDAFTAATQVGPTGLFELARDMAQELFALGVNLNFAPVADLWTDPKNQVIGNRSYGKDPEKVAECVSAVIRGHLASFIQPCAKHFPGHGPTSVDSHLALPRITLTASQLMSQEWIPFQHAIQAGVGMLMTGHLLLPEIDPEYPSTLSEKTLNGFLRRQLAFHEVIVSDDLEMQGITDHYTYEEAPLKALLAGCDLLIYRSESGASKAYQSLKEALIQGSLPVSRVLESYERLQQLKARRKDAPPLPLAKNLKGHLKSLGNEDKLKRLLKEA